MPADLDQIWKDTVGGQPSQSVDLDKIWNETAGQPSTALEAGIHGALQGASANWADEIAAASSASGLSQLPMTPYEEMAKPVIGAARLAWEHMTGNRGEASDTYDRVVGQLRERERQLQTEHPTAYGVGEVGGALGTAVVAPASAARTMVGRIAGAVAGGAGYGALAGAGAGEGVEDKLSSAGRGAVTGAALGAAGSVAAGVIAPVVGRVANVIRGLRNPDAEASRRIAETLATDWQRAGPQLTPEEIAALNAAGTPRAIIDAGGERARALARSAANTSPEARAALTEMSQERFQQQSPRIANFIRDITGGANASADLERIEESARRANRPNYQAAYAAGENGIWTDELERLTSSPTVRQAMRAAVERGRDRAVAEGYGAFNPGVTFEGDIMRFGGGPGAPPYPNMQYWDYVQRELRDAANAARRTGRNEEAGAITGLRRRMLGELDNANPQFATARQGAAAAFSAENALEAGGVFARSSTADIGDATRAIARMSAPERELFARGYASELADRVTRARDNTNVVNNAFLNSESARQKTVLALGNDRANQLEALLRAERIVDRARTAIGGNSTTARQLVEMGLAGGAESLLEQDFNPSHFLTAALVMGAARRGAQVIDQRVARRVGEMLASNDPAVLARGAEMAGRNPAILARLRQATAGVGRAVTESLQPSQHAQTITSELEPTQSQTAATPTARGAIPVAGSELGQSGVSGVGGTMKGAAILTTGVGGSREDISKHYANYQNFGAMSPQDQQTALATLHNDTNISINERRRLEKMMLERRGSAMPPGVPPGSRAQRSASSGLVRWVAPDGSIYSPSGAPAH